MEKVGSRTIGRGVNYIYKMWDIAETDIDPSSGAVTELNRADVRQVTDALRRGAVKNLPPGSYNVMTTETVYSQGSAVLGVGL